MYWTATMRTRLASRLVAAALVVLSCLALATDPPDLAAVAHCVTRAPLPFADTTHSFASAFWLSPRHAILAFSGSDGRVHVRKIETKTGRLSRITLGKGLEGQWAHGHGHLFPSDVSPNGRVLIGLRDSVAQVTYEAVGVGSSFHESWRSGDWPKSDYGTTEIHWLRDSRHWFYWNDSDWPTMVVYSIGQSRPVKWRISGLPTTRHGEVGAYLLGITRSGDLIAESDVESRVRLYRFRPGPHAHAHLLAAFTRPPSAYTAIEHRVSPEGDRIAWVLERVDADNQTSASAICVSNVDGSHFVQLGETPFRPFVPRNGLMDFSWLPDGRSLGLVFDHHLWTLSVPGPTVRLNDPAPRTRRSAPLKRTSANLR